MAQLPPVHMKLNPDNFDLLMTILAFHTEEREIPGLANDAHDLMDKRMRFSRLCTDQIPHLSLAVGVAHFLRQGGVGMYLDAEWFCRRDKFD